MRIFRGIFLIMIASIVLVHSLVPHEHHDKTEPEICIATQDESKGILDWITFGLHINQSEGHLEHFLKDQKTALILDLIAIPLSENPTSFTVILKEDLLLKLARIVSNDHLPRGQYLPYHGLRAPPTA